MHQKLAKETGIVIENVTAFPQFAYPPWFALTTIYLGLFPIESAATLWFEINLTMVLLAVWLLTDGWEGKKRLIAFPLILFFIPVLGTLIIGQYDVPVLLGAAVLYDAFKKEKPVSVVLGFSLLTFKPHLGGMLVLAGLLYLFLRRDAFGRQTLIATLLAASLLFVVGFITDSQWFANYIKSLLGYRELGHITSCSECANLSVWFSRWLTGDLSLLLAAKIGALLFVLLLIALFIVKPPVWKSPGLLVNAAILTTLFVSPYLYNYDYILLVFPILWLAGAQLNRFEWVCLVGLMFLPAFALLKFGRDGNISLLILVLFLGVLLMRHQSVTEAH